MLNIIVFACAISVACGTQYAYFDNNEVEFDPPAQAISLPYPYKETKVLRVEQEPVKYGVGVRTAFLSSPTVVKSQDVSLSPFGLMCSIITTAVACIKNMIMYIINSIPSFLFNCFSFFNLASVCNYFNIDPFQVLHYVNQFTTALTSPERLKRAAEFVQTALKQYTTLQDV